jgi:hypothetical protein
MAWYPIADGGIPLELSGLCIGSLGEAAEEQIRLPLTLFPNGRELKTEALVDRGASASFMHPDYVWRAGVTIRQLDELRGVKVIDGRPISSGMVTHIATTILRVGRHHRETETFYLCDTGATQV